MPAGHLIVRPARHAGVLPVGIVKLQLDEVHLGVRRQNLVEKCGVGMERETVVLDQALLLELRHEVPDVIPVIDGVVVLLDGVEQVIVEVASPGPLERGIELLLGACLVAATHPRAELGGQSVRVTRVALHERLTSSLLGARIDVCRVKVRQTGCHELVDHDLGLLDVDGTILELGKAHQTKAELGSVLAKVVRHARPPLLAQTFTRTCGSL